MELAYGINKKKALKHPPVDLLIYPKTAIIP
jgi:hypothetical protein